MGNVLYADGGSIGKNPSSLGGMWAWCEVVNGEQVRQASGILTIEAVGLPAVTNQVAELYALSSAVLALPDGWSGAICSDSLCALQRVFQRAKLNNVPPWLISRVGEAYKRYKKDLGAVRFVLLGGHPTKAELERGFDSKGREVSEWNVWCDKECGRLAKEYTEGR